MAFLRILRPSLTRTHIHHTSRTVQRPNTFANCSIYVLRPISTLHTQNLRWASLRHFRPRALSTSGERKSNQGGFQRLPVQVTHKRKIQVARGVLLIAFGAFLGLGIYSWSLSIALQDPTILGTCLRFFEVSTRHLVVGRMAVPNGPITLTGVLRYPLTESPGIIYLYGTDQTGCCIFFASQSKISAQQWRKSSQNTRWSQPQRLHQLLPLRNLSLQSRAMNLLIPARITVLQYLGSRFDLCSELAFPCISLCVTVAFECGSEREDLSKWSAIKASYISCPLSIER